MIDERTRTEVQRLCTHVLARERFGRTGRIGLTWTGRGIGTDRLWLDGDGLHRSPDWADGGDGGDGGDGADADGPGRPVTTLADAAELAGVDLDSPFSVGHDTPPVGDARAPITIDPAALAELLAFFARSWALLTVLADGAPVTLWPEHFDAAFVWRERANVGASPGDDGVPDPYVYVGPWGPERPGPARLWNAPFGAVVDAGRTDTEIVAFVRDRLDALDRKA
ncbi:MAG: hypothetical protein AB7O29_12125 [Acidimicrobiia bacterium]